MKTLKRVVVGVAFKKNVMTQENKDLLLKDLCARLPYSVKIQIVSSTLNTLYCNRYDAVLSKDNLFRAFEQDTIIRPYLRPMSSMTEEERKEYNEYLFYGSSIGLSSNTATAYELIDWLLKNHFDFMGLIPKGLAIEAPERMYN